MISCNIISYIGCYKPVVIKQIWLNCIQHLKNPEHSFQKWLDLTGWWNTSADTSCNNNVIFASTWNETFWQNMSLLLLSWQQHITSGRHLRYLMYPLSRLFRSASHFRPCCKIIIQTRLEALDMLRNNVWLVKSSCNISLKIKENCYPSRLVTR